MGVLFRTSWEVSPQRWTCDLFSLAVHCSIRVILWFLGVDLGVRASPMVQRSSSLGSVLLAVCLLAHSGWSQEGPAAPAAATTESTTELGAAQTPSYEGGVSKVGSSLRGPRSVWEDVFSNPVAFLLVFMVLFYLVLILPNYWASKKSRRQQEQLLSGIKKNDRVVTSFGVHGVVAAVQAEAGTVTLRIDENTNAKMTVNRESIRVVKKD